MQTAGAAHAKTAADVARELDVDLDRGVSSHEVESRRAQFGANVLVREGARPAWRIFIKQFASLIVLLLTIAAIIAYTRGDIAEGTAILAVLAVNAIVGFAIEWRSERALSELRLQTHTNARVVRDGNESMIDAMDLVAGDVIVIDAGSRIPADARIVHAAALEVEEAALTGESMPVAKHHDPVTHETQFADRKSMLHLGTSATAGRGRAIVTAVGEQTELGRIGRLVRESVDESTPLERQLATLGRRLVHVVLVIAAVVAIAGVLRGDPLWEMLEIAVSLAVAAIPEGLPAVTTLILARGVLRMAKQHAIVRRLPAVETLGSTTVICTDKTGTLTMNRLTVRAVDAKDRDRILRAAVLCNDATLAAGDPTEIALLVAARDAGIDVDALRRELPRVSEEAFTHESKRMITTHAGVSFVKGAPGVVLQLCGVDDAEHRRRNDELAAGALRVLAFAEKRAESWEFLGFIGMIDPPRPGAAEAVAQARDAGVRVVMLTGDQQATARAIAKELNIDESDAHARVSPADKLRIVEELRAAGDVVAVTGDGVNDAPALRRADIGIAMGKTGTDVAKQSADLILTDDNLGTVIHAIGQGRTIYANIGKFVHAMFSHNFGEVLTVFIAIVIGMPLPLLPLQILWMNLVTDIFPSFALALEPSTPESMRRPSRTALMTRSFLILVAWQGAMLASIALASYAWSLGRYGEGAHARTVVLFVLIAAQLGHTFNCRSRTESALKGLGRNIHLWFAIATVIALQFASVAFAPLARVIGVVPLGRADLIVVATAFVLPIAIVEIQKLVIRWKR